MRLDAAIGLTCRRGIVSLESAVPPWDDLQSDGEDDPIPSSTNVSIVFDTSSLVDDSRPQQYFPDEV